MINNKNINLLKEIYWDIAIGNNLGVDQMWKKLFYGASKKVANDVSRAYGQEKKQQLLQGKEKKLVDDYRRELIDEYKLDTERQQEVKEIDDRLDYLVSSNNMCNNCILFLKNPFERIELVEVILNNLEELRPRTLSMIEEAEYENDYYQERILETVTPCVNLSNIIVGNNEEDSIGFIGIIESCDEFESEDNEEFEKVLLSTIEFVLNTKNQIREVFEETKKVQIVQYFAYGETGEVDFGIYTIDDLL